jgi:hypothetical protein
MTTRKRNPETSKSWTVLIISGWGDITSFRLPRIWVIGLLAGLGVACALAVFAIVSYRGVYSENRVLRADIALVKAELVASNQAKDGAEVRLMVLAAKDNPTDKAQKKTSDATTDKREKPKGQAPRVEKAGPPKTPPTPQPAKESPPREAQPFTVSQAATLPPEQPADAAPSGANVEDPVEQDEPTAESNEDTETEGSYNGEPVSRDSLTVEQLEIWKVAGENSARFQFSLKNTDGEGRKASGYTFVVLTPDAQSPDPARGSPWTPLKDGKPTTFKRGQYFSIARFKYVKGSISHIHDATRFKTATVYVYTEGGDLWIEKTFDIAAVLRS